MTRIALLRPDTLWAGGWEYPGLVLLPISFSGAPYLFPYFLLFTWDLSTYRLGTGRTLGGWVPSLTLPYLT
jgi:hypothetical protein